MKHVVFTLLLFSAPALRAGGLPPSVLEVNAPLWVGRPPSDAVSGLVQLENGELRHYDYGANHGISYVHFQSTGDHPDQGLNVESVNAEVIP